MPPKRKPRPSPDKLPRQIGRKIHKARKAMNWSMENLALEAGTSRSQIFYAESGERNVTVNTIANIAFALGLPTSYFFDS